VVATRPFRPLPGLFGAHLETIVPSLWPAPPVDWEEERRLVAVGDGGAGELFLALPRRPPRGTVLLVHGMAGDVDSPYVRRAARRALDRGWAAARLNLRNCGGTEAHARSLYNAGQCEDVGRALADLDAAGAPRPLACVGFSLGGGTALRHAGRAGHGTGADAFVALNPPLELETCVRALERPSNRLYHRYFVRRLCEQVERIRRVRALPGPPATLRALPTLRAFDASFTAPDAGYPDPDAYYAGASAAPHLGDVARPALVLSAGNDPIVPRAMLERCARRSADGLEFRYTDRGGHLGYLQRGRPRCWAAETVLDWLERVTRAT